MEAHGCFAGTHGASQQHWATLIHEHVHHEHISGHFSGRNDIMTRELRRFHGCFIHHSVPIHPLFGLEAESHIKNICLWWEDFPHFLLENSLQKCIKVIPTLSSNHTSHRPNQTPIEQLTHTMVKLIEEVMLAAMVYLTS